MPESHRDRFLRRLSTVGTGLREDIQLTLGGIVSDLRQLVIESRAPDDEVQAIVEFHDDVEALWRAALRSNPPLRPEELLARLRELRDACGGPVAGVQLQLDRTFEKAQALKESKRHR